MTLSSFTAQGPLPGVTIKECNHDDHDCGSPVQTLTTADDGSATVNVPSGPGGFGAYLDFSDPSIAPTTAESHFVDPTELISTEKSPEIFGGWNTLDANTWEARETKGRREGFRWTGRSAPRRTSNQPQ